MFYLINNIELSKSWSDFNRAEKVRAGFNECEKSKLSGRGQICVVVFEIQMSGDLAHVNSTSQTLSGWRNWLLQKGESFQMRQTSYFRKKKDFQHSGTGTEKLSSWNLPDPVCLKDFVPRSASFRFILKLLFVCSENFY